jgi:hypothetical protein
LLLAMLSAVNFTHGHISSIARLGVDGDGEAGSRIQDRLRRRLRHSDGCCRTAYLTSI